jgi:DNA-binding transcriptional MerR regulator
MATRLTITEAAEASGLTAPTLRYYERAGLLEPVDRDGDGHRRYREQDLDRIRFLTKLRATGMPIAKNLELIEWKINLYRERLEHQA